MALKTVVNFFKGSKVVSEVYFIDERGQKQGQSETFHENGALYERCLYKNGEKDGPFEKYFFDGKLREKGSYKANELCGPYEEYHENGRLAKKETYCDEPYFYGSLTGTAYEYYRNGQLKSKRSYQLGRPKGTFWEYHDNGQLRIKGHYNKDNELDGPYEEYTYNGGLVSRGSYIKGKRLGVWAWVTDDERFEGNIKAENAKEQKIKSELNDFGQEMRANLVLQLDSINLQMKPTKLCKAAKYELVKTFHERCQKYLGR